jgi:hypothetical protein
MKLIEKGYILACCRYCLGLCALGEAEDLASTFRQEPTRTPAGGTPS